MKRNILTSIISSTILFSSVASADISNNNAQTNSIYDGLITNSIEISNNVYPEIVMFGFNGYICTGTFVDSNTILTAGHCAASSEYNPNNIEVLTGEAKGQSPSNVYVHPNYNDSNWHGTYQYDLAVLKFDSPVSSSYRALAPQSARAVAQQRAAIIGFGNNNQVTKTGAGVKRLGIATVSYVDGAMIYAYGHDGNSGSNQDWTRGTSLTGGGDSGGPIFAAQGILGVTSGGSVGSAFWVDIHSNASKAFLNQYIQ
ncbi:trypsin-like serine protease [Pseudoalteromonas luteoviolacea]|uniref:S1 family peptidase n=1 Tax=Pseudoalteromonas luteoviolacea TaxID=43657 RepID=UPI001EEDE7AB|nr:trypsin-like serine protease [Pseudoalteromonas luteoviolacea]MCF6441708.1 trypsin-like serine protease [Pseudoalteromonas luteoviolacea]